jgi:hypothetical protein
LIQIYGYQGSKNLTIGTDYFLDIILENLDGTADN